MPSSFELVLGEAKLQKGLSGGGVGESQLIRPRFSFHLDPISIPFRHFDPISFLFNGNGAAHGADINGAIPVA